MNATTVLKVELYYTAGLTESFIYSEGPLLGKGKDESGDIKCWDENTRTIVENTGNQNMKKKSRKKDIPVKKILTHVRVNEKEF